MGSLVSMKLTLPGHHRAALSPGRNEANLSPGEVEPQVGCPASMRPGWGQCLEIHVHLGPVLQSVSVVGT